MVKGMVISTANRFSNDAIGEAKINAGDRHEVKLFSFEDVVGLLGIANYSNLYDPWANHLLEKGPDRVCKDLK